MPDMKILLFLCVCAMTTNSHEIAISSLDLIESSSPKSIANLILGRLNSSNSKVSLLCSRQLTAYALSLAKLEKWALNMFDSNAKFPSGLLRGNAAALGSFDQCLMIQNETKLAGLIKGKYCLGSIPAVDLTPHPIGASNYVINLNEHKITLQWGRCVPDGCTNQEIEDIAILPPLKVYQNSCQTMDTQTMDLDLDDYGAIVLFTVVATTIILSTSFEAYYVLIKKEPATHFLFSFSVISNTRKIFTVKRNKEEITCLHGMKVISLLFLIYGYGYGTMMLSPVTNFLDVYEWLTTQLMSVYFEGILVVDTFFLISGLLISYNYLKLQADGIVFNIFWHYLGRIIRLSPPLFAVVLLHATLMRHLGSGPTWPLMRDTLLVKPCRDNWWSTLLYVQNYVNPTETCVIQSWHLAVDMQLFLLSPLFLMLFNFGPKILYACCGMFVLAAAVVSFVIGYVYEIKSLFLASLVPEEYTKYMSLVFFSIQTHAPPWTIGFVLGYIIHKSTDKTFKNKIKKFFRPPVVLICWIVAVGLVVTCFAGPGIINVDYNWVKNSLHLALVRICWSIPMAWVIFACLNDFSGPVNDILSSSPFQIISRISYCTFLMNITVIMLVSLQARVGVEFSHSLVLHKFWPNLVYSLTAGFVWTLVFESPMIRLQKALFPSFSKYTSAIFILPHELLRQIQGKKKKASISTPL